MGLSWWFIQTNVFTPIGFVFMVMLLSGFQFLERPAHAFCNFRIRIADLSVRVVTILFCAAFISCLVESANLHELSLRATDTAAAAIVLDKKRASLSRHQRNWWISLLNSSLWLVIWRVSYLIRNYRQQLLEIAHSKEEKKVN